jgi:hypothetical protein
MAQYLAEISSRRGRAVHRLGDKSTGAAARCQGWELGVEIVASWEDGGDVFRVFRTGGSDNPDRRALIAVLRGVDCELIVPS